MSILTARRYGESRIKFHSELRPFHNERWPNKPDQRTKPIINKKPRTVNWGIEEQNPKN